MKEQLLEHGTTFVPVPVACSRKKPLITGDF